MKHLIATALIAIIPSLSFAVEGQQLTEKLSCTFTEPFFTLEVDLNEKTVTLIEPNWESDAAKQKSTVIANSISLEVNVGDPLYPSYAIKLPHGETLMELTLNMQGSDGMSDFIYPFEVKYDGMWGGCSSDRIKEINPADIYN